MWSTVLEYHFWMTSRELPRERLLAYGPKHLSIQELISVVLGVGNKHKSVFALAQEVEQAVLHSRSIHLEASLRQVRGLGSFQISRILASIELGRRTLYKDEIAVVKISTPEEAIRFMRPFTMGLAEENFFTILVNVKNIPIRLERIAQGTQEFVHVLVRDIFSSAVQWKASGIVCVHNHPSGDPTPSREDFELTEKIKSSAELLGIRFLDHIVFSDRRSFSITQKKFIIE